MDLPSMSRVTKLPMEVLLEKAKSTPVFAPGLANLEADGCCAISSGTRKPLANQLEALLGELPDAARPARRL